MSAKFWIILGAGLLVETALIFILTVRLKIKKDRPLKFRKKWTELQKFCASRETWPLAVIAADKLLDEALKKRRLKGKSMGERMVSAQRDFSDNDTLWFAHNMAKKVAAESIKRLRESDVKKSLVGIRQGLRDLGVLNDK